MARLLFVDGAAATVFVQDVYHGLEPQVKRGEIKKIAVVQEVEKETYTPQNNHKPDDAGPEAGPRRPRVGTADSEGDRRPRR